MRHAFVIARREIAEKRFVLYAALAFAALPFLVAAIPIARGSGGPRDVMAVVSGLLCIGFTLALALILGANVIGRDLSENRLSFYFARPVGAASIWFGKVAGALALIVVSFAVILLPARLAGAARWNETWPGNADVMALGVVGLAIVLFFFAHVLGTFVRSRSAWVALDFVAACAAAIAGTWMIRSMTDAEAFFAAMCLAVIIACGVVAALVGGGAWQLACGRTDRRRSHRALSQFVWSAIGATLVMAGAYTGWLMSATPNDLTRLMTAVPRAGSWIILGGETRGRADYHAAFVYNLDSGAWTRIPPADFWRADLTADGKTLVIGRADRSRGTLTVCERPVDRSDEHSTGLTLHRYADFVTNATGDRIAALDGWLLSVYDVPQQRTLAAARLAQGGTVMAMYFQSPTVVRIFILGGFTLHIFEFDVERHALQLTGKIDVDAPQPLLSGNADGSKFLVRDRSGRLVVIDGRSAAVQPGPDRRFFADAAFLHDGRIAVSIGPIIELYEGGKLLRAIRLPFEITWRIRETRDGKLLVPGRTVGRHWETFIVDPATGAVQRIPAAALSFETWSREDPRRVPVERPRFFFQNGRVVRWNYATQQYEVIVPKG